MMQSPSESTMNLPPSSNNIRVVVRVRPLNEREQQRGYRTCIQVHEAGGNVTPTRVIDSCHDATAPTTTTSTPQQTPTATPQKTTPVLVEQSSNNLNLSSPLLPNETATKPTKIPRPATRRQSRIPTKTSSKRPLSAAAETSGDEQQQQQQQQQQQSNTATTPMTSEKPPSPPPTTTSTTATRLSINNRSFELDAVFGPASSQAAVYQGAIGSSIRQRVMQEGYNTTVIAYGQTGSGKTFTNTGIIDAAIQDLFVGKANQEKEGWKVSISLTCVELCLEEFRDLLVDDAENGASQNLQLRGDGRAVYVEGATTIWVETPDDARAWVQQAAAVRATSATLLNEQSSRSHAVFTFHVQMECREMATSVKATSKLTLVDLAGSERIKQTGVVGSQQKESININKDLFVLGKVMSLLSERSQQQQHQQQASIHIPYRDSKLTRLLQDSLGGNCCTVLIACVSPAEMHADESLNTLRYAERARSITNSMQRNVTCCGMPLSAEESAALRAENQKLHRQVQELRQQMQELSWDNRSSSNDRETNITSFGTPSRRLFGLQEKISRAKQEAKAARANSLLVMQAADRWRTRLDEEKSKNIEMAVGEKEKEGVVDDVDGDSESSSTTGELEKTASTAGTEKKGKSEGQEKNDSDSKPSAREILEIEMKIATSEEPEDDPLMTPKDSLLEELMDLSAKVDAKRAEFEQIELDFGKRHATIHEQITKAEQYRDELVEEVNHLKLKLHLLATDLKDDSSGGLRSIFRSYTGEDEDEDEKSGQVEMKTINSNVQTRDGRDNNMDHGQIRKLQSELEVERAKSNHLEELNTELTERIQQLVERESMIITDENRPPEATEWKATEAPEAAVMPPLIKCQKVQTLKEENERLRKKNNNLKSTILKGEQSDAEAGQEGIGDFLDGIQHDAEEETDGANEADQVTDPSGAVGACDSTSVASTHDEIRSHAERMLSLVDKAIGRRKGGESVGKSMLSNDSLRGVSSTDDQSNGETVVISNMDEVKLQDSQCNCVSTEIFGKKEYVDFYLPKISITCMSCGKKKGVELSAGGDPCALGNILKEWQVDFLSSVNLYDTVDFIHACNQRRGVLAKEMKRWRKNRNMSLMKTDSCAIALHVWSCTCRSVIKAVSEQKKNGAAELVRPDFMEIALSDIGDQVVPSKQC